MYLRYALDRNDRLEYARMATRSQHRTTYFLTYGLINLCVIMLVLSFFFYYLSTPIVIEHVAIPPRDELGVFFITLFITFLLVLLAWHYKKQFSYLFQLALMKTDYANVEIWADAKQLRCRLDGKEYTFHWAKVSIKKTQYQTCLVTENPTNPDISPLILIPRKFAQSTALVHNITSWKQQSLTQ